MRALNIGERRKLKIRGISSKIKKKKLKNVKKS